MCGLDFRASLTCTVFAVDFVKKKTQNRNSELNPKAWSPLRKTDLWCESDGARSNSQRYEWEANVQGLHIVLKSFNDFIGFVYFASLLPAWGHHLITDLQVLLYMFPTSPSPIIQASISCSSSVVI